MKSQFSNLSVAWDEKAINYDLLFGSDPITKFIRDFNVKFILKHLKSGNNTTLLDLGCGSGEDAIFLAKKGYEIFAIDISQNMINQAQKKAEKSGVSDKISYHTLRIEQIGKLRLPRFDSIYSSFGPLNYVSGIDKVVKHLYNRLRPNGLFIVNLINKFCISEFLYFLMKRRLKKSTRRWFQYPVLLPISKKAPSIYWKFYTPKEFYNICSRYFSHVETVGLPIIIFPLNSSWSRKFLLNIFIKLIKIEKIIAGWKPINKLGDHFIMVMKKR